MKVDDVLKLVYMPGIGLLEAGNTMKETIEKINRAEAQIEVLEKRERRILERDYPGCKITKLGSEWCISHNAKTHFE